MNFRSAVLLTVLVAACGGGGGSPTSPSNNNNSNTNGSNNNNNPQSNVTVSITSQSSYDSYYGSMTSYAFSPANITVAKGGTVAFSNSTGASHNITFTSSGAPSNISDFTDGTKSVKFDNAGTFNFMCTNHQGMTGKIVVQ